MIRYAIFCFLAALPAAAQSVSECDWRATATAIAEPWSENTRSYANGAVRVAVLDTLEPAAAAVHLLILSPPDDEIGNRQCRIVSLDGTLGFNDLNINDITARYDAERGLVLALPAALYDPETSGRDWRRLGLTINQQTGDITADLSELRQ